jgi:hypothetical protein
MSQTGPVVQQLKFELTMSWHICPCLVMCAVASLQAGSCTEDGDNIRVASTTLMALRMKPSTCTAPSAVVLASDKRLQTSSRPGRNRPAPESGRWKWTNAASQPPQANWIHILMLACPFCLQVSTQVIRLRVFV